MSVLKKIFLSSLVLSFTVFSVGTPIFILKKYKKNSAIKKPVKTKTVCDDKDQKKECHEDIKKNKAEEIKEEIDNKQPIFIKGQLITLACVFVVDLLIFYINKGDDCGFVSCRYKCCPCFECREYLKGLLINALMTVLAEFFFFPFVSAFFKDGEKTFFLRWKEMHSY